MKKFFILTAAFFACHTSNAQLTVYSSLNQQGTSGTCVARTIYTDENVPSGLNNSIKSITLKQGFMATFADNTDGSGEGFCYIASASDLNINLANILRDKISFIRVLPLPTTVVKKKGACEQNNVTVNLLNVSWFYDWGILDATLPSREFVPMAWGKNMATPTAVTDVTNKTGFTTFLGFNEPDGVGQANLGLDEAATLYNGLLRSGYRMGSPATTESQYRLWLSDFTTLANQQGSRIDFVCVHWYDWGNWLSTLNANPNPVDVFNRFKSYITAVYNLYQKPIWITEFNANKSRPSAVQEEFMKLALPWLDADPRVERYSYFFGNDVLATSGGLLTPAGRVYADHTSSAANPQNVVDRRAGATTAVEENTEASFVVYPSVVSQNTVEATFNTVSEATQIKIFNINGQLMQSCDVALGTSSKSMDIAHFTEGVYFLTLQDKDHVVSRKFIKQ
jgi:hypothetical protein